MSALAVARLDADRGGTRSGEACGTPCRFCGTSLRHVFVDLGSSPLANAYLPPERVGAMEPYYPLRALVCSRCFLVQLEEYVSGEEIFTDYAYFSSFSDSWLDHCRRYVDQMIDQLHLTPTRFWALVHRLLDDPAVEAEMPAEVHRLRRLREARRRVRVW